MLAQPEMGHPGQVPFVLLVDEDRLEEGIDRFVDRIRADPDYHWTNDLVFLLGESRRPEVRQLLRSKADDFSLRPSVLITLAESPEAVDRPLFVSGLDTHDLSALSLSTQALEALGPDDNAAEQVALVRTLRRLGPTTEERSIQDALIRILRRNTGQEFGYEFGVSASDPQSDAIAQWTSWAGREFPDEWARQSGAAAESLADLNSRLESVDWSAGDAARGEQLYHKRSCSQCHGSSRALGPDLTGVAGRFSRQDLFTAIALPNQDVAPRYQATTIVTADGRIHTGLVIYESVDGLVLRTSTNQTLRIETEDIETQRRMNTSLMPTGLLNDLQPTDLADLYAYLRTLGAASVASP
jgi:putative heme-binding domain-containing protein